MGCEVHRCRCQWSVSGTVVVVVIEGFPENMNYPQITQITQIFADVRKTVMRLSGNLKH